MSLKLVKRLLQVTANDFHTTERTTTKSSNAKKRGGTHNKSVDETPIEGDQEQVLMNHYVSKLVGLDRAMMGQKKAKQTSSSSTRQKKDKRKLPTKTKGSSQTAKHNMILGNTRSSASALQNQPLQPTFQKCLYRKQQKETKLKEIGKLLKETKKKMAKHDSKTKGKSSRLPK
jgi:hypothetical protein